MAKPIYKVLHIINNKVKTIIIIINWHTFATVTSNCLHWFTYEIYSIALTSLQIGLLNQKIQIKN